MEPWQQTENFAKYVFDAAVQRTLSLRSFSTEQEGK